MSRHGRIFLYRGQSERMRQQDGAVSLRLSRQLLFSFPFLASRTFAVTGLPIGVRLARLVAKRAKRASFLRDRTRQRSARASTSARKFANVDDREQWVGSRITRASRLRRDRDGVHARRRRSLRDTKSVVSRPIRAESDESRAKRKVSERSSLPVPRADER